MKPARVCDQCHGELPGDAPEGLCPKCLLKLGGTELGIVVRKQEPGFEGHGSETAGRRFGNYEVLEKIAQGGMGAVYKARQLNLDRVVALKLLPFGQFSRDDLVQRFRSEASAAAALQHPNIVAVHDVGEHDGQPFFSMDLVEGRTLAELVRDQPLPAKRAASYLKTIAEAVHYAHQQGILHRDLKPSNVLIDASDQPRITDFGLAKRLSGDSDLTLTGQVLGSPNFMSPEQAEGRSDAVGPPSDVYSLGAVLYHLLTRQPPFQADTLTTLLKQVLEAEPVPPRSLNPSIPRDLETICLKCLEKSVTRRYSTAQALAEELGRYLRGEPIQARPVSAAVKAWKWCRARPVLSGLSAALIVTLLAGVTAVLWQLQQTRASELAAHQNAYAADMNLAQAAVENGDLGAAMNLLDAHRPALGQRDLRGWEWRHLWQRCRGDELFVLTNSATAIERVALSPDGRWLGARDEQATLAIWDIGSRQHIRSFKTHGFLDPFAFSRQRNLLGYYAAGPMAVSIVSLDTQQEIARLVHANNVAHLAFFRDGAQLISLDQDGTLTQWDIASQKLLHSSKFPGTDFTSDARRLVFSPDGSVVAFCVENGLGLWEWNSGRQARITLTDTEGSPTVVSFSPDGKLLAVGLLKSDSEIYVWTVEDLWRSAESVPPPRGRFGKHRDWIYDLAFSPDNRHLVSAGADSTLQFHDLEHPGEGRRFQGHHHQVLSVAWSPDGQQIVSSGADGSMRVWNPSREPAAYKPSVFPTRSWTFRVSADGKRALALDSTNGLAVIWDTENVRRIETLEFAGTNLYRLAWSPDGRTIVTTDGLRHVSIWDLRSRRAVTNLPPPGPGHAALYPEFSHDGRFLLCGALHSGKRVAQLWEVEGWREIRLPREAMRDLTWVDFSPDGRSMVVLRSGGALEVWHIPSGHCQSRLSQPFGGQEGYVAFSPDGRMWASSTTRGALCLWDAKGKRPPNVIPRTAQELWDISFTADSTRLLVCGRRGADVVRLLDPSSRRFVGALAGKPDSYWYVRMSTDNSTVTAVAENAALLWRAPSWAEIEAAEKEQR